MFFALTAFLIGFLATRKSLGAGVATVLTAGFFHGIIRANFVSVYTTFFFDSAVLGLYTSILFYPPKLQQNKASRALIGWITALTLWPLVISAIPQNDLLVQFVAFRATAWFLPMLWIGSQFKAADLRLIAMSLAGLNLIALAFGVFEFFVGVEAVYPVNAVTQIIYKSGDVAGKHLRIPSTFLNAHAYGGTMVCSLPFLLGRLLDSKSGGIERGWLFTGTAAACIGVLLCAARQPVVVAVLLLLTAWFVTRFSPRVGLGIVISFIAIGYFANTSERFQRFTMLIETQDVAKRIRSSVNESFLDIFATYPFGAGMGSSAGTSVPYFLDSRAPKKVGLENEYCRILVDQGWVGLLLWGMFLFWVHWPPPKRHGPQAAPAILILFYALTLTTWATAVIGTGLLAGIPSAAMLLLQMGAIVNRLPAALPNIAWKRSISRPNPGGKILANNVKQN